MVDIKYWAAFKRVPRLGTVRFRRLEAYFGDLEKAWNAGLAEFKAAGLDDRSARDLIALRGETSPEAELEKVHRAGIKLVTWHDDDYPVRLKEIADPPPVLYYKGTLLPSDERSVAVVGTRGPTSYGREATAGLTGDLARNGIAIISGLARGVDGVAHRAALENGGRTIAVLANGLDIIYPREHTNLAQQITEHGAIVSEHPPGVRPDSRSFPRRNRLISGISLGSLVVEAGEGSGARWTVYHALEQNREVFCVPGSIYSPMSRLTNRLIQEGAKLVSNVTDILEELNLTAVARQVPLPLPVDTDGDPESALLSYLNDEPKHIDDIRRSADIPIASVSSMLTMLELKGMVRQVGCMHYVRLREVSQVYGN
jgi:DNA processing protein